MHGTALKLSKLTNHLACVVLYSVAHTLHSKRLFGISYWQNSLKVNKHSADFVEKWFIAVMAQ